MKWALSVPVSVDEEDDGCGDEERGCDPAPGEHAQQLETGQGEAVADGGHGGEGQARITACSKVGFFISLRFIDLMTTESIQ